MRSGILAAGVALVIIGISLFYIGHSALKEMEGIEEFNIYGLPIGKVIKYISEDYRDVYIRYKLFEMVGCILTAVGFILSIAGIVVESKGPQNAGQVRHMPISKSDENILKGCEIKESSKHCPNCGASLDEGVNFCTNCGTKLK